MAFSFGNQTKVPTQKLVPVIVLSTLQFIIVAGCTSTVLRSTWRSTDIIIDGKPTEWASIMQYPDMNNDLLGVGIMNDENNLYLCIAAEDQDLCRHALAFGFTVMLETANHHMARFGIHYPLGMHKTGAPPMMDRRGAEREGGINERFAESLGDLEIFGPGDNQSRTLKTVVAESYGIHSIFVPLRIGFIYEMQIPLNSDSLHRYAINSGNDSLIHVRFESLKPDIGEIPEGRQGPPPGMGGPGGGMPPQGSEPGGRMPPSGGGMGHMGPGGPPQTMESYKLEFVLRLAKKL